MFSATEISARLEQRPFKPVRLVMSSGESYDVLHPDLAMVGQREVVIGIANSKNPEYFTSLARASILHITAMEDLPTKKGKSNGNGRRTNSAD